MPLFFLLFFSLIISWNGFWRFFLFLPDFWAKTAGFFAYRSERFTLPTPLVVRPLKKALFLCVSSLICIEDKLCRTAAKRPWAKPPPSCSWARIFSKLFSKSGTFGSKNGTKSLVRRYQAQFAKIVSEYLKVCHIWLIKFFLNWGSPPKKISIPWIIFFVLKHKEYNVKLNVLFMMYTLYRLNIKSNFMPYKRDRTASLTQKFHFLKIVY